jgi:glucokinase
MTNVPVLEVGGTHVTAAWVDSRRWRTVPGSRHRLPLDSAGTAEEILSAIASDARRLGPLDGSTLGVAIPGPFDYALGVGRFSGVGKFDALNGVDVRAGLLAALPRPPRWVRFLHDATAFGLGEWVAGAACGHDRVVALTIGTGVGSAFLASGRIVTHGGAVPPEGRVDLLRIGKAPLEDIVSRRAILAEYARRGDATGLDVADIAKRAHAGEPAARDVLYTASAALGTAIAPWLRRFGAQVLVVGGTVAASWDLVGPPLRAAAGGMGIPVVRALDLEEAGEIGTAWHVMSLETRQ